MKEYLSYYSAALFWNIPFIETVLDSIIDNTSKVNYTVTNKSERFLKKDKIIHLCEIDLPDNAVVLKDGILVASPELVFLQLASCLDMHRLILLGLQLCSHPPGKPSEAITTKQKLKTFIAKTPGHRGHRNASRAVNYIEDGSASVMESVAYMILSLPHSLGGYGLDGAVFNYELLLKDEAAKRLGQKRCYVDLYYKKERLAVEYDSFAFHNRPMNQGKDAIRSAILERHKIDVMHLSTIQLYDKDACKVFAFNLASHLGKRMQIRAKKFDRMHALLRTLLPVEKQVNESDYGGF
ncbi:MAG TPA: hypothetical protein PLM18_03320 [Sedimentibacter sp.]|nr:hypothetical protein [Sedimentibacter sp.]